MLVAQLCLTLCDPMVPLSTEFSRQEYCSGLPFPSPGDLPNPGTKPVSSALAGDSFPRRLRPQLSHHVLQEPSSDPLRRHAFPLRTHGQHLLVIAIIIYPFLCLSDSCPVSSLSIMSPISFTTASSTGHGPY